MEFDNSNALFKAMKIELYAIVLFGASIPVSFLGVYKNDFLPLKDYQYALLIAALFFSIGIYWYGLKQYFFSLNTNTNDIVIKYFRIVPKFITLKPKMIKIPKNTYVKYTIETSFFGKRKALILFQRTKKGVVKYPPIYITALNKDEINKLTIALKYK